MEELQEIKTPFSFLTQQNDMPREAGLSVARQPLRHTNEVLMGTTILWGLVYIDAPSNNVVFIDL